MKSKIKYLIYFFISFNCLSIENKILNLNQLPLELNLHIFEYAYSEMLSESKLAFSGALLKRIYIEDRQREAKPTEIKKILLEHFDKAKKEYLEKLERLVIETAKPFLNIELKKWKYLHFGSNIINMHIENDKYINIVDQYGLHQFDLDAYPEQPSSIFKRFLQSFKQGFPTLKNWVYKVNFDCSKGIIDLGGHAFGNQNHKIVFSNKSKRVLFNYKSNKIESNLELFDEKFKNPFIRDISPDNRYILVEIEPYYLLVYDLLENKEILKINDKRAVKFTRDGYLLIATECRFEIELEKIDISNKNNKRPAINCKIAYNLYGSYLSSYLCGAISPQGNIAIAYSNEKCTEIIILSADLKKLDQFLLDIPIKTIEFSLDEKFLISPIGERAHIINIKNQKHPIISGHYDKIHYDNKTISGINDENVYIAPRTDRLSHQQLLFLDRVFKLRTLNNEKLIKEERNNLLKNPILSEFQPQLFKDFLVRAIKNGNSNPIVIQQSITLVSAMKQFLQEAIYYWPFKFMHILIPMGSIGAIGVICYLACRRPNNF
ncbi:MAG: hypothetical protein WDZ41_04990 [Candidatus Babeliales bacterium]